MFNYKTKSYKSIVGTILGLVTSVVAMGGAFAADVELGQNSTANDTYNSTGLLINTHSLTKQDSHSAILRLQLQNNPVVNNPVSLERVTQFNGGDLLTKGLKQSLVPASLGNASAYSRNLRSLSVGDRLGNNELNVAASITQTPVLSYDVSFSRSRQTAYTSGALLSKYASSTTSVTLAKPVEQITDAAKLSVLYDANSLRGKFTYYGSTIYQDSSSLDKAVFGGSDKLLISQGSPLDNGAQRISLTGAYDLLDSVTASALLSMGRTRRDDAFQSVYPNGNLSATNTALYSNGLEEDISTYVGNFSVLSRLTPDFQVNFNYAHQEQESKPVSVHQEDKDEILANHHNQANLPSSFRKSTTELHGKYNLPARSAVSLGMGYEVFNRDEQQDVELAENVTRENSYWAEFESRPHQLVGFMLSVEKSTRDGEGYSVIDEIITPQNLLLRKYDLASRDRNKAGVAINLNPFNSFNIGFAVDSANNVYSESKIGLTDSKETSYTVDANYMISKFVAVTGFYSLELINSNQIDGQNGSTATNAYFENEDQIDTAGIGLDYHVIADTLDVGFDFRHAEVVGKVNYDSRSSLSDLRTKSDTLELYSNFQYNDVLLFKLAYRYEKFDDSESENGNPASESSDQDASGKFDPKYNIGEFALSVRYKF